MDRDTTSGVTKGIVGVAVRDHLVDKTCANPIGSVVSRKGAITSRVSVKKGLACDVCRVSHHDYGHNLIDISLVNASGILKDGSLDIGCANESIAEDLSTLCLLAHEFRSPRALQHT